MVTRPITCLRCHGNGFIEPRDGARVDCAVCGGTGKLNSRARAIARDSLAAGQAGMNLDRLGASFGVSRKISSVRLEGFEFDDERNLWAETNETFQARIANRPK